MPIEVEHLYDRSWFAVTETCLAMTIFRDEFTSQIVALFGCLLAMKMFHWLAQDRVEYVSTAKYVSVLLERSVPLGSAGAALVAWFRGRRHWPSGCLCVCVCVYVRERVHS